MNINYHCMVELPVNKDFQLVECQIEWLYHTQCGATWKGPLHHVLFSARTLLFFFIYFY